MDQGSGVFIVLEGVDGSGKGTQFRLLAERLKAIGYDVEVFDFPRYGEPSSHFVKKYLNGEFGPASQISPYTASLFYALDRFEAAPAIRRALRAGKIVLSNRYVGSNMAHQGSKFGSEAEQRGFFIWADSLEYGLLNIPRPNVSVYLRLPAEIAFKLIGQKTPRGYTESSHDEHESDIEHLRKSLATYERLARLFPKDFRLIDCTKEGKLQSIPAVNNMIWEAVSPLLPPKPQRGGHDKVFRLDELLKQPADVVMTTEAENLQPSSQETAASEEALVLNLNNLSMLAAGTLYGAPGISVAKRFSIASADAPFQYYALSALPKALNVEYKKTMQELSRLQAQLKEMLSDYLRKHNASLSSKAIEALVDKNVSRTAPLATLASVRVEGSVEALKRLIKHLGGKKSEELKWLGAQLLQAASKQRPQAFQSEKARLMAGAGQTQNEFLELLAESSSSYSGGDTAETVQLLNAQPRNEFELLADSLYPLSNLPKNQIAAEVESWPYEKKLKTLREAVARVDSLLDQVRYQWDVVTDQPSLEALFGNHTPDDLQAQPLTPRYGYEVPRLIEEAGAEEPFLESFDLSLQLFSAFQQADREELGAYSTLLGHKIRWQFTITASRLQAVSSAATPAADNAEILSLMREQIGLCHPIIADVIFEQSPGLPKKAAPTPKSRSSGDTAAKRHPRRRSK